MRVYIICHSITLSQPGKDFSHKAQPSCGTKRSNIGIKHGFSCINIHQVPREVLKNEARGLSFQHLPRDLANVNTLINHVRSLLLHKN